MKEKEFSFNVISILSGFAERFPDWKAGVTRDGQVSFAQLHDRVAAWMNFVEASGVSPGTVVALTVPDDVLHLELSWAIAACGAVSINVPSFRPLDQRAQMVRTAGATVHFVQEARYGLDVQKTVMVTAQDRPNVGNPGPGFTFVDQAAQLLLFSTSGTTGAPKVFARTVGHAGRGIAQTTDAFLEMYQDCGEQCNLLRGGSVEHDNHRVARFMQVLAGGCNSILDPFEPRDVSAFCAQAGVTVFSTVAFQLQTLLSDPSIEPLPDTVMLSVGGAPVPRDTRRKVMDRLTKTFHVVYATSEMGVIATAGPDDHLKAENCLGRPGAGIEVSLRDDKGKAVAQGEKGIAWVRTGAKLKRYLSGQDGEDSEGWFNTGDVLSFLEDGCLAFHGRSDDMIVMNGINIFPQAIESCLMTLPNVKDVAALGIPSETHGQIPVAAVVVAGDPTAFDIRAARQLCRQTLGVQAPRAIQVVAELPRSAQGKVLRRVLEGTFQP